MISSLCNQCSLLSSKGTTVCSCHQTWSDLTGRRDVAHWCSSVRMPLGRRWADTSSISASVSHLSLPLTRSRGNRDIGGGCKGRGEGKGVKGMKGKGGKDEGEQRRSRESEKGEEKRGRGVHPRGGEDKCSLK